MAALGNEYREIRVNSSKRACTLGDKQICKWMVDGRRRLTTGEGNYRQGGEKAKMSSAVLV